MASHLPSPSNYTGFIQTIERDAALPPEGAERAARATLQTLGERLSGGEAHDLADRLPDEAAPWIDNDNTSEPFDLGEFLRRVAMREGVSDAELASQHARAVFAALGATVGHDELHDMASELPKDFDELVQVAWQEAEHRPPPDKQVWSAEDFDRRVARRAGVDEGGARRATEAVLETLAERITGGQVADLMNQLPGELHPPLLRGDAASNGAARPMSLEEFVARIAEREGVPPAQAREHARAVFATLREAVGEKEMRDTEAQLPDDYHALLAR
jgi:uncharacterized protein (DUF2267 family)